MLFGFRPAVKVRLNIYRSDSGGGSNYEYLTSVPVSLGRDGTRTLQLPTSKDDAEGCYVARVDTPKGPLDSLFCLGVR